MNAFLEREGEREREREGGEGEGGRREGREHQLTLKEDLLMGSWWERWSHVIGQWNRLVRGYWPDTAVHVWLPSRPPTPPTYLCSHQSVIQKAWISNLHSRMHVDTHTQTNISISADSKMHVCTFVRHTCSHAHPQCYGKSVRVCLCMCKLQLQN